MPRRAGSQPRVGLLTPYWDYFEATVRFDLRADREAIAAAVARLLRGAGIDVLDAGLVDSPAAGAAAATRLGAEDLDALVVVQALCVPPAHALAALEPLPAMPLVVAATSRAGGPPAEFDHGAIAAEGATVGTPQLTNALQRLARPHRVVAVALGVAAEERELVAATTRAAAGVAPAIAAAGRAARGDRESAPDHLAPEPAAVAAALRGARILRVGAPIAGYVSVDCDADALRAATGIELVGVPPAELRDRYLAISADEEASLRAEAQARFELTPDLSAEDLSRSLRLAGALAALDRDRAAAAGALNCHLPELRLAADPGVSACFALGRETGAGIPWSCSGDAVTAVALLVMKRLGAATLYHEIEALDRDAEEAILANSGEHDLGLAAAGTRPRLGPNRWWERNGLCGACACFSPAPGPATLVAFTPHPAEPSGFRFVVAEGEFTSRQSPATGTFNAGFRFAGTGSVVASWLRWVRAGVNHHSVASGGHWAAAVGAVAAELGIGCVEVTR